MKGLRPLPSRLLSYLLVQASLLPLPTSALPTKKGTALNKVLCATTDIFIPHPSYRYDFGYHHWCKRSTGRGKITRRGISIMAHRDDAIVAKIQPDDTLPTTDNIARASPSSGVYLRLCPKCKGEGKISKALSKKARLRKQRRIYQQKQEQELPQEIFQHDSYKRIKKSPLTRASSGLTSGNGNGDDIRIRDQQMQFSKSPRRWDPCSKCDQSGLLNSSNNISRGSLPTSIKTTHQRPFVAIIGGGIGGIALAVALKHRDIPYMVYEKDSRFDQRRQGYGLTLQQARRALQALGIFEKNNDCDQSSSKSSKLVEEHAVTSTKHVVHTPDGKQVGEWGLRRWVSDAQPAKNTFENLRESGSKIRNIDGRNDTSLSDDECNNSKITNSDSKILQKAGEVTSASIKKRTTRAKNRKRRQNLHIPRQTLRRALLEALKEASSFSILDKGVIVKDPAIDTNNTKSMTATKTKCWTDNDYRNLNISWGHKLINIQPMASGPLANDLELSFEMVDECGNGKGIVTAKASLVVGCDGIRSKVREQLFGTSTDGDEKLQDIGAKELSDASRTTLRYLNCVVILGICPLGDLVPYVEGDHQEKTTQHQKEKQIQFSPLLDGETVFQTADGTTRIYVMPYSKRNNECMWQLSFPVLDEVVAIALSRRGPKALKEEALRRCESWHNPIPEILNATPVELVSGYPVYDRDILTTKSLSDSRKYMAATIATLGDGKSRCVTNGAISSHTDSSASFGALPITLLGDAAHPMSPFKGQGANQALLDALSLARALYRIHCREGRSLGEALEYYEHEMLDRSAEKVRASSEAARFLHTNIAIQEGDVTRGAAAAVFNSTSSTLAETPKP